MKHLSPFLGAVLFAILFALAPVSAQTPPPNVAPTANAGPDQTVTSGATVRLDASGSSDSDGSIATYAWSATDGVTLTGADTAGPGFTAPTLAVGDADVTITATLTVTDNDGATATDTVVITVEAPNAAPTANAGPDRTVASGATVTLDGSGSNDAGDLDGDGSIRTYAWTSPQGITLTGADTDGPTFTAPTLVAGAADVTRTFTLTVTDNDGATATDTVVITVTLGNVGPTANAGPDRTVASGTEVTLDGSGSNDNGDLDGDGSIASYAWTASDGVTLTGANTASPGFTAPTLVAGAVDVTRTFTLTVTDTDGATATDTVVTRSIPRPRMPRPRPMPDPTRPWLPAQRSRWTGPAQATATARLQPMPGARRMAPRWPAPIQHHQVSPRRRLRRVLSM